MTSKPAYAAQYLHSPIFRSLLNRVELHRDILKLVRQVLPDTLADHCKDCLAKESRLLIFTDSPAWASQLRFHAPVILAKLNSSAGLNFSEVQLRNLTLDTPADQLKLSKTPSAEVVRTVNLSCRGAPPTEIREALVRLGATIERYATRT